jgi:ribosomal protein L40E
LEKVYWESIDFEYRDESSQPRSTSLHFKTPILAEGESVLWHAAKLEGIVSKKIEWIWALTNFRALNYDFRTHQSGRIALPNVEEIVVLNKRTESQSSHVGTYSGDLRRYGVGVGSSKSTSRTVGDMVFMKGGTPIVTFLQVCDPQGLVDLAKAAKEQLLIVVPTGKQSGSENQQMICSNCGNLNSAGSTFCNKCGSKLNAPCLKCGNLSPEGSSFCNKCGSVLQ